MDVRISPISRISTDFRDKKSVGIREIGEIRTSIRITTESYFVIFSFETATFYKYPNISVESGFRELFLLHFGYLIVLPKKIYFKKQAV
jgi:hypothetical protein